ncbi:hypothetical protein VP01_3131g5 [Puccinia sorghi]|uniref:Uncharacterized protein n=1 Tax=Puccinia sorghi TaxID=27349 RepID=A0A0L6V0Y2_9BASI|nr:hypothetical protein VP01_3131g5 [Puccinia sorghi]
MLLKFLLAPIALAMATTPVPNKDAAVSRRLDFNQIVAVAENLKQPIIAACNKNQVQEVNNHLIEIHKPVSEIAQRFHLIGKLGKDVLFPQARIFIAFLKVFELILREISHHQKVSDGSHKALAEFQPNFDLIVDDFRKYKTDFHSALDGFRIDVALWVRFGFKFQSKIGV